MPDLSGRVAIVTGGANGLGAAQAAGFARAGAAVAIADIDGDGATRLAGDLQAHGGRALALTVDVGDEAQVRSMVERTVDAFGRLDILVNNAAFYPLRPWHEIPAAEWDRVFAVNARSAFLGAQAAYPHLKASGHGRIISIASVTFFVGFPGFLHYASSKGALVGLTRTLAREVGPDGITVNAVSPGAFPTAAEEVHPNRD